MTTTYTEDEVRQACCTVFHTFIEECPVDEVIAVLKANRGESEDDR